MDNQDVSKPAVLDVVVVGAGFAGMYMLHKLRSLGMSAVVIEAGTEVGGTWYWNRYPGARCDVPSMEYSYSFSDDLQQEWEWSEAMSAQPEILAYAKHVADRFDLRRDIRFETRVTAADFDESSDTWVVSTDGGPNAAPTTYRARWCVMATGCLSVPNVPDLPGLADFEGEVYHTGDWPKVEPNLAGKRVGIFGTGSSGVQAIPVLAERAGHLTVFQRSPVYTVPANNRPIRADVAQAFKQRYAEIRERQRTSATGILGPTALREPKPAMAADAARTPRTPRPGILDLTPEQRVEAFDQHGPAAFMSFADVYRDPEANAVACELFRREIRKVVADPAVAERLEPRDYPLACKRQVIDTNYYETFNRDDVALVDLRTQPLVEVTPAGVCIGGGESSEGASGEGEEVGLDVLVLATGFDAMTGALERIDIRGRGGLLLRDRWADGPRTYLGLQVEGFPNLFTITGPGSPSVLSNVIVAIEQHVEWIADCLRYLTDNQRSTIETTKEAVEDWVAHVNEVAEGTMYVAPDCNSWYLGSNIEGKARVFMPYVGGLGRYRKRCDEVAAKGYEGFVLA